MTAGNEHSLLKTFIKRFCQDRIAVAGLSFVVLLILIAIYAPLLANGQPLMVLSGGKLSFPAWRAFFAPDSPEMIIERFFNYLSFP